jgi:predicted transcriptional regulator
MNAAEKVAELLKCARSGWVTRRQIQSETGVAMVTVSLWTRSLVESGILLKRQAPNRQGEPRFEYVLAPEWGGPVELGSVTFVHGQFVDQLGFPVE